MRKLLRLVTVVGVGSMGVLLTERSARAEDAPAAAGAPAAMTADQAADVIAKTVAGQTAFDKARIEAAEAALTEASKAKPTARYELALAQACAMRSDNAQCKAHAEKAVALDPTNAEMHYWYGNALFQGINSAGALDKLSIADKGKKEYEKALELDPNQRGALNGLATYYVEAPGIAGGSIRKAKEMGKRLLAIEGAKVDGHTVMARACAEDGDWKGAAAEFEQASAVATTDEERLGILRSHASLLLRKKEDPKAALPILEKALELSKSKDGAVDSTTLYLMGSAKQKLKDYDGAIEKFRAVLAANANAMNTRYGLAQCLEAQEKWAEAAAEYQEFAARFPKESRAEDATKMAAKLKKKAEKGAKS